MSQGISTFKEFILKINIGKDASIEDEFKILGGEGYDFIPYNKTQPVIGGISNYHSLYNKILRNINGYIHDGLGGYIDQKLEIKYRFLGEKLKSEIALANIDENALGNFMSAFTGSIPSNIGLTPSSSVNIFWSGV